MDNVVSRRVAMLAAAGCVFGTLPGCGPAKKVAATVHARVPWLKIIIVIIDLLVGGGATATVRGEDADGNEQSIKVTLTPEQLKEVQEKGSVTIELGDGTKKTVTPKIENGK
jgi:hypothetical protein